MRTGQWKTFGDIVDSVEFKLEHHQLEITRDSMFCNYAIQGFYHINNYDKLFAMVKLGKNIYIYIYMFGPMTRRIITY